MLSKKCIKREKRSTTSIHTADDDEDGEIGVESKFMRHIMMNEHKNAMIITSRVHPGET